MSKVSIIVPVYKVEKYIHQCVYAQKDVFDCPWIAPEITKNAIGAKRLAKYLSVKGKLILIKRDSNKDRKLTTVARFDIGIRG